jgi:uncharacterized protein YggE
MKTFFVLALASFAICTFAEAQETTPRPAEISTTGRGEIRVPPSHAVVLLTVENSSRTAAQAASDNAKNSQSTIQSLRNAGVKESEITNGGYGVAQDFENGDRRKPRGFIARNIVRVDVPVANIGKAIDAAVAAGTTNVSPVQFLAGDLTQVRRDALKLAVQEARRDAEALAEASGGSLGRMLSMNSSTNPVMLRSASSEVYVTGAVSAGGYVPTDLRANDITVTATASGRWEFVPRR